MSEQLKVWDLRTAALLQDIRWSAKEPAGAFIFSCQFSKHKRGLIVGAASGSNEIKVFDLKLGEGE
jgi:hypothetical protein